MASSRSRFWVSGCVALSACSAGMSSEPDAPREVVSERRPIREYSGPQPGPLSVRRDAVPDRLLQDVLTDASRRAGVPLEKLEIASTERITWNDGSLGCHLRDGMVTQATVPGYRILIRGPEGMFDYHAAASGAFVMCPLVRGAPREPAR